MKGQKARRKSAPEQGEIRQFRRKITAILTIAFAAVILILLGANAAYYVQTERTVLLQRLENRIRTGGEFLDGTTSDSGREAPLDDASGDEKGQDVSLLFSEESEGTFTLLQDTGSGLSRSQAEDLASTLYGQKKRSGTYENWIYAFGVSGSTLYLSAEDLTGEWQKEERYLVRMLAIGLILFPAVLACSYFLSGWLTRPLRQAMQRQTDFLLAAGHELKTPLSVIRTSLDMMEQDGAGGKYFDYARSETERMAGLVTELLDLSRLESGRTPAVREEFDLSACIEGAVLPFEALAYERGARLETDLAPGIFLVGDPDQIARVAGILVDNAVHHCRENGTIRAALKGEGKQAVFSVANEGDPIPEEERERISEEFYRVDKARNRREGRYGLGLPIAKHIVEAHGGRIRVDCQDGWTTFTVSLAAEPLRRHPAGGRRETE